jgi:hypothetical protein
MRRFTIGAVLAALVASATVSVAFAARKPDHDEAVLITKAFKTTKVAGLNTVANKFNVVNIRVSTVNPSYARANINAKPKYRTTFQNAYGVAKYVKPAGWKVIDVGSSMVGCGKVPKAVRKDLKLLC